jgi:hypothetical protein
MKQVIEKITSKTKKIVNDLKEKVGNEIEYRKNTAMGRSIQSIAGGIKNKMNVAKEATSSVINKGLNTRAGKVVATGAGYVASAAKTVVGAVVNTGKKIVSTIKNKTGSGDSSTEGTDQTTITYQLRTEAIKMEEPQCPPFPTDRDMTQEEIDQFGRYFRYHKDKGDMSTEELNRLFQIGSAHIRRLVLHQEDRDSEERSNTIPEQPYLAKDRDMTKEELEQLERYTRFYMQDRKITPEEQEQLSRTTVDRLPELQASVKADSVTKKRSMVGKILHGVDKKLGKLENQIKRVGSIKKKNDSE